jgi:uncharacterized alpha/beta hydrolase family protein
MVSITIIVGVSLIQTFDMLICFIFMFVVIKLTKKNKKIKKKQKQKTQINNIYIYIHIGDDKITVSMLDEIEQLI